ncbi:MAG TPA: hypothetical protein DEA51_02880 [Erysipelotrichaceae bacterium]|nr:hypothetical protein [Erysipelotrichaceae bacterium]
MKQGSITNRFRWYILIPLLSFAILLSFMFFVLFKNYATEYQQNQLISQAQNISEALSSTSTHMSMGGMGMYLRFLYQSMEEEVWVVDKDFQILTRGRGAISYQQLPEEAKQLVTEVFEGKSSINEGFNLYLDDESITVGTPLYVSSQIVGVVLVHTKVENVDTWVNQGLIYLMISLLIGMSISFVAAWLLSKRFTKPLIEMSQMTSQIASGKTDVTVNYRYEDELGTLAQSLNHMALQLKQASHQRFEMERLRKNFIASVSHELKTPVTVLSGAIESLMDRMVETEDIDSYYEKMQRNVFVLKRLISDLLELTRLDSPDFTFEKQRVDTYKIMEHCLFNAQFSGAEKKIHWHVDVKSLPKILGDEDRLTQLFTILLDNAIQYSYPDKVISVIYRPEERQLLFEDEGEGIDEHDLPHIFDQFYKGKSEQGRGSGLGLALASKIAKVHDLDLRIESEKGVYTRVIVQFGGNS